MLNLYLHLKFNMQDWRYSSRFLQLGYLEYLTEIGLINSIKQAKSKGVNVMILYSEEKRDGMAG